VNILFLEFLLENLVVDLVFAGEELRLAGEVVWTERHLHEELLGDFAHSSQVWMHVVFGDGTLFSRWVTEHLPSVDDMGSWNVRQSSNSKDLFLHVILLGDLALRGIINEISVFLWVSCHIELVEAS